MNDDTPTTPEPDQTPTEETYQKRLIERLHNNIIHGNGYDEIDSMKEQAGILNEIMHYMLFDASKEKIGLIQFNTALRAQNQYRQTVQAIESIGRSTEKRENEHFERLIEEAKYRGSSYSDPF